VSKILGTPQVGLVTAVPAALSGLSDWVDTAEAERRVGMVHAAVNDAAIASYSASWFLRRKGHHSAGVAAGFLGTGLLALSGWLGGHLVYARGVGIDTTAFQVFPTEWTDTISEKSVPASSPAMFSVHGVAVLLIRTDAGIVALSDRCTHRGGPLHQGKVSDGIVTCPWHGSRFSIADGCVVDGPATRDQPLLETRVRDGTVQVRRLDEVGALRKNPVS
jgi:nitrite reductase/ring-hydroxylating ferredoxin subunit